MNLLLWVGNQSNQKALAHKLGKEFNIVGIVRESSKQKRKITFKKIVNYFYEKIFLSPINNSWWGMIEYYNSKYPDFPDAANIVVENINSAEAYEFSKNLNPDLIIVSGTRLVKNKMLSLNSNCGILNLHTGVSPFIKGGPNCTNWCIATNQFHLVGNTIMWIDEGIDSGNIVTTELTSIDWSQSLLNIHIAVMDHAHALYVKAVKFISQGGSSNVAQSLLGSGKIYYTKQWNVKRKKDLIRNLKKLQKGKSFENIKSQQKNIKTVGIALEDKLS